MSKLNLRIRFPSGQGVIKDLETTSQISTLIEKSFSTMNLDMEKFECTQILTGYPPKPLDISNKDESLDKIGVKSGDTLIFKINDKPCFANGFSAPQDVPVFGSAGSSSNSTQQSPSLPVQNGAVNPVQNGVGNGNKTSAATTSLSEEQANKRLKPEPSKISLKRIVVPADNSCLFTSINYCMCGELVDSEHTQFMREIISTTVASDLDTYSDAVLGRTNEAYCSWIKTKDAWGGAIEIQILAEYFQVQIVVVDTKSVSLTKFGEFGNFSQMMLLIYDGIHYDALCQDFPVKKTTFSTSDQSILDIARKFGENEKKAHNYTDTTGFTLKCLVCGQKLTGQKEAQSHAMATKHSNFSEIKSN